MVCDLRGVAGQGPVPLAQTDLVSDRRTRTFRPGNYLLNDCIRNTTAVCNLRQNLRQNTVRDKIQSETKFSSEKKSEKNIFLSEKKFCHKKNCVRCCLGFPVHKVNCLGQIDAYHH